MPSACCSIHSRPVQCAADAWVRTDMGGASASLSVVESVTVMRQASARLTVSEHGRLWTWNGHEPPW